MENYVIPGVVTEDDVKLLNEVNLLKDLADCSKGIIVESVLAYIENPSSDDEVTKLLIRNYGSKLNFLVESRSDEMDESVKEAVRYNFYTPYAELSIEQLNEIKHNVEMVTREEVKKPYNEVIPGTIVAGLLNNLLGLFKSTKDKRYYAIYSRLQKNVNAFKNKRTDRPTGTKFKRFSKMDREFKIISDGVDFLIRMKNEGKPYNSWRWF